MTNAHPQAAVIYTLDLCRAAIWKWKPHEMKIAVSIPDPSNVLHLRGIVMAPDNCPMEKYIYFLSIDYPPEYPFKPPKVKFETAVWHPKVNNLGSICMPPEFYLSGYNPARRPMIDTILLTVQSMIKDASVLISNMDHYLNGEAVKQVQNDPDAYTKQAKEWAEKYNEGYGIPTLDDYYVEGIQSFLKVTPPPRFQSLRKPGPIIRYELRVYCQKVSYHLWRAITVVFPCVEIFKEAIDELYSGCFKKLTGFEFDFLTDVIIVGNGESDEDSIDKCWKITVSNATIQKECVDKFRKHSPVTCEVSMRWVREDREPRDRLMHKVDVKGAKDPFNSFTICVEPSSYTATLTSNKPTLPQILHFPVHDNPGKSICLLTRIGASYYKFGVLLLDDETGDIVDSIATDKNGRVEPINQEIFRRWLNGGGVQPATWETLIRVLKNTSLSELAKIIERNC